MNKLTQAVEDIDFYIIKHADKEIFNSYNLGKSCPKLNAANDLDHLLQLNKSFFFYYKNLIDKLPESEQTHERIKMNLALAQIEGAIKILSYNRNILDKNNFLFYNVAYVSDILKRNCSINNEE